MRSLAILALAAGLASADEGVVRVGHGDLGGLLWIAAGDCGHGRADDLWQRQCQAVRAARAGAVRGKTFVVRGDARALASEGGAAVVRGCLACAAPAAGLFLVTRGGVEVAESGGIVGPELGRVPRAAPLPAGARVDLYFTLAAIEPWTQGGARGVFVDPVGWRAYDPCRGELLAASPATPSAEHDDTSGCTAAAAAEPAPAAPELPAQPSAEEIKAALDAVAPEVAMCFDRYGVPGTADVALEVDGDGEVAFAGVRGTFADTPTGACVAAAVKKARFPRFARAPMRMHYPFVLR